MFPLLVLAGLLLLFLPSKLLFVAFNEVFPQSQEEIVELAALLLTLFEGLGLLLFVRFARVLGLLVFAGCRLARCALRLILLRLEQILSLDDFVVILFMIGRFLDWLSFWLSGYVLLFNDYILLLDGWLLDLARC